MSNNSKQAFDTCQGAYYHDTGYKELFSYPELVQQLIEGFFPPEIAALMDFKTLQIHSGHYITPLFEEKIEDVVWSVNIQYDGQTQSVYLYMLMEFQSSDDKRMALRFMHYVAGFYSQLIKQEKIKPSDPLPPVFPIVLYNGNARWQAPTQMSDMIHSVPGFLQVYQPQLQYYLVDEGAYSEQELDARHSPISGVFYLENAKNHTEIMQAVEKVVANLQNHPDRARLDKVITRWFKRYLQRINAQLKLDTLNSLTEEKGMLAQNIEQWIEQERRESLQQGMQQGKLEMALEMVRQLNVSVKKAAEVASVSVKDLMDYIKQHDQDHSKS
ncbi:MAG: Rpn family recombination-promoting nuclease/putative transposase [Thiomicrospira sp.]